MDSRRAADSYKKYLSVCPWSAVRWGWRASRCCFRRPAGNILARRASITRSVVSFLEAVGETPAAATRTVALPSQRNRSDARL